MTLPFKRKDPSSPFAGISGMVLRSDVPNGNLLLINEWKKQYNFS
jgi:hypothetical protein